MSLRFCLLLLSAVLSTLCVVAAQVDKHDPEKADSKPTSLVSSILPVSTPTPWQSPVLADLKPTREPQPTVKEPTEPQPTVPEPSLSPSLGQTVPKNARAPPKPHLPVSKCFANKKRKTEYKYHYHWAELAVPQLVFEINDEAEADWCLNFQQTIDILRRQAPEKPRPSDLRTYCQSLGYYKGFMWAIDSYKRICETCPFSGPEHGFEVAMLICDRPSKVTKACYHKHAQRGCKTAMLSAIEDFCPEKIEPEQWGGLEGGLQVSFLGCWM